MLDLTENIEKPPNENLANAKPLSKSPLWQLQKQFFLKHGLEIWKQNIVPSYVTSNPFIANAYAQIVFAYLEDCVADTQELSEPIYIIELGAGSGEFCFHFLKSFLLECEEQNCFKQKFCYLMTDISQSHIEHWRSHPQLKTYVDQGVLDFACCDISRDENFQLIISGKTISCFASPLVAIANYVFDCTPQDLFQIKDEKLYENLVSLNLQEYPEVNDVKILQNIELTYHPNPCSFEYYKEERWNQVLQNYGKVLNNKAFSIPTWAFSCLDRLKNFSNGQALLLSGDKGIHQIEKLMNKEIFGPVNYGGCFTLNVNYHALSEYAKQLGGEILQIPYSPNNINILAFLFGENKQKFRHTKKAFRQYIIEFSPSDFFAIKKSLEKKPRNCDLQYIAALLRLSQGDVNFLIVFYERLIEILSEATPVEKQDFCKIIEFVWQNHFFLKPENNPVFYIANLMGIMGFYQQSITYYKYSQEMLGNSASTEFNIGLSYLYLGEITEAYRFLNNALLLDEKLILAKQLLSKILVYLAIKSTPQISSKAALKHLKNYSFIEEKLKDPNIKLELLVPGHKGKVYQYLTNEIAKLTKLPRFSSEELTGRWIAQQILSPSKYTFAITSKSLGFVGVISLTLLETNKQGTFFFWLGKEFWGKGYGTIALCQLLEYVFTNLAIEELFTIVDIDNYRSCKVMNKLGFKRVKDKETFCYYIGLNQLSEIDIMESFKNLYLK